MFGIGLPELILILVIVLIFVGPKKLPAVGASLGKALRAFRATFSSEKTKAEEQAASESGDKTAESEQSNPEKG